MSDTSKAELVEKLSVNPAERTKFLANIVKSLEEAGVNVSDEQVFKEFGLDRLDRINTVASTNIITLIL